MGPFHAVMTSSGPCAWIGGTRRPFLWPDGYEVRFTPTELIAPDGHVVAREGETITSGGGGNNALAPTRCGGANEWTWSVMGRVSRQ